MMGLQNSPDELMITTQLRNFLVTLGAQRILIISPAIGRLMRRLPISPKRLLNQTGEYFSVKALREAEESPNLDVQTIEIQQRAQNKQQLLDVTKENPDVAADIIKGWINEVR